MTGSLDQCSDASEDVFCEVKSLACAFCLAEHKHAPFISFWPILWDQVCWFTSANHAKQAGWPLKSLRQDTWWTFHILRAFEFKWIQRLESEFTFMIAWSQTWLYASLPFRQRACNVVNTDSNGWKLDSGWRLVVRNIQTQISRLDKHMAYMDLTEYTYNSMKPYHQFQLPRTRSHAHQPCMWDAFKKCTTILLQNFIVIHRYTLYT